MILANTTNETIVALSEQLTALTRPLKKVFYAGDGSCAVEIAMKMSLHVRKIQGEHQRTTFIALKNAYHGETVGAMSVSDLGLYRKPYESMLFDTVFISSIPYVHQQTDALWFDCETHWEQTEKQLSAYTDDSNRYFN